MSENQQTVFRQKTLERISSPEQLTDYLRVTNPGIWAVLAAVIPRLRRWAATAKRCIKRPMFFFKLLLYVFDESNTIHQVDALDTLAAVKFVHHLSRAGFVTHDFSVVEGCHSPCEFSLNTVVRASDFFGYLIGIPAVFPSCLDNHSSRENTHSSEHDRAWIESTKSKLAKSAFP